MNDSVLVLSIASAVVAGTPILLAALGEIVTERSGVMNLGVEGMMLVGAAFFWAVAPLAEPAPDFAAFSAPMWASLAYGVFLNYGWAQVLWFGMARRLPPAASAFSIMAVPLVGTLGATVIVGETPGTLDWLAAAAVVTAIASALLPRRAPGP